MSIGNLTRGRHVGPVLSVPYEITERTFRLMARSGTLPVVLERRGAHVRDSHDEGVLREITAMMFAADSEQVS